MRTNVRRGERLRITECLLNAPIPLKRIRKLEVGSKTVCHGTIGRLRRVHDRRRRGLPSSWKWRSQASLRISQKVKRTKTWACKAYCTPLLTCIEEYSTSPTQHRLPARRIIQRVGNAQAGGKVIPSGLPERRPLRRKAPSAGAGALNGIAFQALEHSWRRIYFPAQAHREIQTLGYFPFVCRKGREICEQGVCWRYRLHECVVR